MKIAAVLSLAVVGVAEATFERDVAGSNNDRELWHNTCCEWVCDDEPSPSSYYYVSKAGMKGQKGGYYRRTEETNEQRELPGKGFVPMPPPSECYWDCDPYCGGPGWGPGPGYPGGYMCFPTYTDPDECECTCCGYLPVPTPYDDDEPSPSYYYVSKAGRKGNKGGYYSRRTQEVQQKQEDGERNLGGGYGGYYGGYHGGYHGYGYGPSITCDCECDPASPSYYPSKAGMKGNKGTKGGYYDDYYGYGSGMKGGYYDDYFSSSSESGPSYGFGSDDSTP